MDQRQWRQAGEARSVIDAGATSMLRRHGLLAIGVGFKTKDGVTTDEVSVKAFVPRKLPVERIAPERLLPKAIDVAGARVLTDVEEMHPPTAPALLDDTFVAAAAFGMGSRWRQRPISGGDSVSRFPGALGTIGAIVRDRFSGRPLILSCNHVLAALNWARAGDPVVQPAAGDGGTPFYDRCGALLRWVPLSFGAWGLNRVDAAVAAAETSSLPWIDFIGLPSGVRSGNSLPPAAPVFKVGRTTRLTSAAVAAVHVTGWITYSFQPFASAFFTEQIITTGAAGFGDSGSLLFDADRNAVGLLFGGSPTHTFYNDIVNVENELGIALTTLTA
jgi:hypothetical protein